MNDEELVSIIKKSSDPMQSNEMSLLIYRYTRIIRIKAVKLHSAGIDADDLQQEGYIALFDAVRSYEPERGSFAAFAGKCISNRMKNAVLKARGTMEKADDYDVGQIMDDAAVTDEYVIVKEYDKDLNKKLAELLTEKEYSVLKLYLEGYSYKQIAEKKKYINKICRQFTFTHKKKTQKRLMTAA